MRLFVAIDLPEGLADDLAAVQERLRAGDPALRYTDPTQAHVTLQFLGDVESTRVDALADALDAAVDDAGVEPFEATAGGLGVFPSRDYVSVVWVGFTAGDDEMGRLHEVVERAAAPLGFDPEDRAFTPHVTLARMDSARGKDHVLRVVDEGAEIGSFRVEQVRLKESDLGPEGPTYSTVRRFSL